MASSLKDQVAVITGAGRGIGEAVARALAKEGATVVVNDVLADLCEAVAHKIEESGGAAVGDPADLSTVAAGEGLVQSAVERFGRIDILVNNAGILNGGSMLDLNEAQVDRLMAVNFKAVWATSRAALRHMIRSNYGRIVNVVSNAARRGNAECPIYSATKGAVIAMTKANAAEFGAHGITVNAICPKAWTEMERMATGDSVRPDYYNAPVPRVGDCDTDIAPAVVFLCSQGAGYITAQVIGLDGGVYR